MMPSSSCQCSNMSWTRAMRSLPTYSERSSFLSSSTTPPLDCTG